MLLWAFVALLLLHLALADKAEDSRWTITDQVGQPGRHRAAFSLPFTASATPDGDIVVADTGNSRLQVNPLSRLCLTA